MIILKRQKEKERIPNVSLLGNVTPSWISVKFNVSNFVLQEKINDIRESYKELASVNDRLADLINETAQHDVMDGMLDDCDAYMNDVEKTQDQVRIVFVSHMSESRSKSSEVRVKPLDAPSFSGNIRDYSSFKQDLTG